MRHSNSSTISFQLFHNFIRLLQLLFVASQVVLCVLKELDAQIDFDGVTRCGHGSLFSRHFIRICIRLQLGWSTWCDSAVRVDASGLGGTGLGVREHREYTSEQSTILGDLRLAMGDFQRTHTVLEGEMSPTHGNGWPVIVHGCARGVIAIQLKVLIKAERPTWFAQSVLPRYCLYWRVILSISLVDLDTSLQLGCQAFPSTSAIVWRLKSHQVVVAAWYFAVGGPSSPSHCVFALLLVRSDLGCTRIAHKFLHWRCQSCGLMLHDNWTEVYIFIRALCFSLFYGTTCTLLSRG